MANSSYHTGQLTKPLKTLHLTGYNHMLEIGYIQSAGHSLSAIATEYLNTIRDALKENDS